MTSKKRQQEIIAQAQKDFENGLRYEKAEQSLADKFGISLAQARGYIIHTHEQNGIRPKRKA